jgi:hypothetical protein
MTMRVEITPEPSPVERSAILAALEQEAAERPAAPPPEQPDPDTDDA